MKLQQRLRDRLDDVMFEEDISLRRLAARLQISPATLSRWMRGKDASGAVLDRVYDYLRRRYHHWALPGEGK